MPEQNKSEEFNKDAIKLAKKLVEKRLDNLDETSDPEKFKECTLALKAAEKALKAPQRKIKSGKR